MKYLAVIVLMSLLASAWTRSDHVYDWTDHHNSKELYGALKDETDLIFILFWFNGEESNKASDPNSTLKKKNLEIKDKILSEVVRNHEDIVFSEIDLSVAGNLQAYDDILKNIMQIDVSKLAQGPIISVINNGEGAWIHGTGAGTEVAESVDIFVHEAQDRKIGGTGSVYGSQNANQQAGQQARQQAGQQARQDPNQRARASGSVAAVGRNDLTEY